MGHFKEDKMQGLGLYEDKKEMFGMLSNFTNNVPGGFAIKFCYNGEYK